MVKSFAVILLILHCLFSSAREKLSFYNLTSENGLSETSINYIYQDFEGYIWIGSIDGLFKYDGAKFKTYDKDKKNIKTLWNSNISCIYEDKQKNLWVATIQGINKYNREQDYFQRVNFIDENKQEFQGYVFNMFEDNEDNLWAATTLGAYIIDRNNNSVSKPFKGLLGKDSIIVCRDIALDKNGFLWFAYTDNNNGGLLKFDQKRNETTPFHANDSINKILGNDITCLTIDDKNRIWIGYFNQGIELVDQKTNSVKHFKSIKNNEESLSSNMVHSITVDKEGKIFIGTDNGLNVFKPETENFYQYKSSPLKTSLLTNTILGKPCCSKNNTLWFPCKGGGVSVYDKRFSKFLHFEPDPGNSNSLSIKQVLDFTEDKNKKIWISSDGGGINYFDPNTIKFKSFKHDPKNDKTLTNNKVLSVQVDDNNGLWAGLWQGGLCYFEIKGDNLILKRKYTIENRDYNNNTSIYTIYKTNNGDIWVGTYNQGVYKYNPKSDNFVHHGEDSDLADQSIYSIEKDHLGCMWFGTTENGVFCYNEKTSQLVNYRYIENDSTALPASKVYVIHEDSKNRLWFGTSGGGLSIFNRNNQEFTTFTKYDGLPSNKIVGIQEDDENNIWISTNNGLSRMTTDDADVPLKVKFRNYNLLDGLQGSFFNAWSHFKSADGTLFFGGTNGFNMFLPSEIKDDSIQPPVYITGFLLFNNPVEIGGKNSPLKVHISQTEELVLNHNQSIFTFKFNVLNFIHNQNCQFAYKMEGLEDQWNYVGTQRRATYTSIDPGKYTFRVKASNHDGIWNENGASIKIVVLHGWWQTWLFRICFNWGMHL
ncbi:MAG: triple tyrosine motif-containing protein [Salinivirgaceae bacterium]|jgi:ligand-binding sensor domain-containing protein|nr:triple tyrosine motif-containing protein [Salinivirgaceae bacterium]